jgi:hypothetical protein
MDDLPGRDPDLVTQAKASRQQARDRLSREATRGDQPSHFLSAFERNNDKGVKGRVGRGWQKPDGSISIKLNPYVTLTSDVGLTLWPRNKQDDNRT